jgi:hypothetical protein
VGYTKAEEEDKKHRAQRELAKVFPIVHRHHQ